MIGEAVSRPPPEERRKHPAIDWQHIIGMRNRLKHGYDTLEADVIWDVVPGDVPPLIQELERILRAKGIQK